MLVFLFAFYKRQGIQPDFRDAVTRMNGTGKASNAYDQLKDQSASLMEGDIFKNAQAVLVGALSLINHLPHKVDVRVMMDNVDKKNTRNRPVDVFGDVTPEGRRLTSEQKTKKFYHVTAMLRQIRNHFGDPLEEWMYMPFMPQLMDFDHSKEHLSSLPKLLSDIDQQLATQVLTLLRHTENKKTAPSMTSRQITRGLVSAGGVIIS